MKHTMNNAMKRTMKYFKAAPGGSHRSAASENEANYEFHCFPLGYYIEVA